MVRPTSGERRLEACHAVLAGQCRHAGLRPGATPRRAVGRHRPVAGLGADATTLVSVAAVHPGRGLARDERGMLAVRSRKARETGRRRPPHAQCRRAAGDRAAVLVAQLEQRHHRRRPDAGTAAPDDVLGPEHPAARLLTDDEWDEAADVLADAASGTGGGVLPPLVRRELTGAFDRALDRGSVRSAGRRPLPKLLEPSAASTPPAGPPGGPPSTRGAPTHRPWATAMHEASWAGHVSGRPGRWPSPAARRPGVLDGGFDLHDGAAGVWNAFAGCVQGTVVADLLDEASLAVLRRPGSASPAPEPPATRGRRRSRRCPPSRVDKWPKCHSDHSEKPTEDSVTIRVTVQFRIMAPDDSRDRRLPLDRLASISRYRRPGPAQGRPPPADAEDDRLLG